MYLMPKIAGLIDVVLTKGGMARYGGPLRFVAGAAIELVFSFLQGAVSTIRTSIFMIGLAVRASRFVWGGQSRDAYGISWRTAVESLWPQTAVRHRRVRPRCCWSRRRCSGGACR